MDSNTRCVYSSEIRSPCNRRFTDRQNGIDRRKGGSLPAKHSGNKSYQLCEKHRRQDLEHRGMGSENAQNKLSSQPSRATKQTTSGCRMVRCLMANDSKIAVLDSGNRTAGKKLRISATLGAYGITRMAVNPGGDKLRWSQPSRIANTHHVENSFLFSCCCLHWPRRTTQNWPLSITTVVRQSIRSKGNGLHWKNTSITRRGSVFRVLSETWRLQQPGSRHSGTAHSMDRRRQR